MSRATSALASSFSKEAIRSGSSPMWRSISAWSPSLRAWARGGMRLLPLAEGVASGVGPELPHPFAGQGDIAGRQSLLLGQAVGDDGDRPAVEEVQDSIIDVVVPDSQFVEVGPLDVLGMGSPQLVPMLPEQGEAGEATISRVDGQGGEPSIEGHGPVFIPVDLDVDRWHRRALLSLSSERPRCQYCEHEIRTPREDTAGGPDKLPRRRNRKRHPNGPGGTVRQIEAAG